MQTRAQPAAAEGTRGGRGALTQHRQRGPRPRPQPSADSTRRPGEPTENTPKAGLLCTTGESPRAERVPGRGQLRCRCCVTSRMHSASMNSNADRISPSMALQLLKVCRTSAKPAQPAADTRGQTARDLKTCMGPGHTGHLQEERRGSCPLQPGASHWWTQPLCLHALKGQDPRLGLREGDERVCLQPETRGQGSGYSQESGCSGWTGQRA